MSWGKSSNENNFEKIRRQSKREPDERKISKKGRTTERASARKNKSWERATA